MMTKRKSWTRKEDWICKYNSLKKKVIRKIQKEPGMVKKRRQNNQLTESKQTKDEETVKLQQLICDLIEKTLLTEDRVFIIYGFCFYVFCFVLLCKLNNTFQLYTFRFYNNKVFVANYINF